MKQRPSLISPRCRKEMSCGISTSLEVLSPTQGQVPHALLTRSPLYSDPEGSFLVRLACLIHAANVRSEPGSNSPLWIVYPCRTLVLDFRLRSSSSVIAETIHPRTDGYQLESYGSMRYSVFKERSSPEGRKGSEFTSLLPSCQHPTDDVAWS